MVGDGATNAMDAAWRPVKIGGGGWVTGIDTAPDGTIVVRTDTYGGYVLQDDGSWKQLVTAASMPGADSARGAGIYEVQVADSDSSIMYMTYMGEVYRSDDRGDSWAKTNRPRSDEDPNDSFRTHGQKMAIDPNNPDVVLVGTENDGAWLTRDGGQTWIQKTALSGATGDAGVTGIVFFGSQTVYASPSGDGVWRSTDGGNNFVKLADGPTGVRQAAVDADGDYYAIGSTRDAVWKYDDVAGTWSKLATGSELHAIAIDPNDPNHVIITRSNGNIMESKDGGATWGKGWLSHVLESSADVPWLETNENHMSSGGIAFDPNVAGKVWQSAGTGVWHAMLPNQQGGGTSTPMTWTSQSIGIEQLVANDIIAPAGGDPIFAAWDRPFFTESNLDDYATRYNDGSGGKEFSMGWSLDYASSDPRFIVGISDWGKEKSGYSTDGGKTWQTFAGKPNSVDKLGGSIAASSPQNIIWAPANGGTPAYTLDGGKTWHDVQLSGHNGDWSSFHFAYYLDRTTVAADRVTPGTFYLYDWSSGVHVTRDGGVSWTKVHTGQITPFSSFNAKIEAVPGVAGELYFTGGPQGDPTIRDNEAFMRSADGGRTWQAIADVTEVLTFGFGASKVKGGPASIYIVGYVKGDYGIWQSDDDAKSWFQIGETPMGQLDVIKTISGDMDEYGKVYVGFTGSGFGYLESQTSAKNASAVGNGSSDDHLRGADSHDNMSGGPGNDTLEGGAGNDHLYGQSANGGDDGSDMINGGAGSDYIQGNAGNDTLDGGDGTDRIQGGRDNDLIIGGKGNDSANGNLGNDSISGGPDNDMLRGGQGNDTIAGDTGNDQLQGDMGIDLLAGGDGADIFIFGGSSALFAGASADVVQDFRDGSDLLKIGYIPHAVLTGTSSSFSAAATTAQQLFDGHAGASEVAAVKVGADTFLFYSSNNGTVADSAIQLIGVDSRLMGVGDFV